MIISYSRMGRSVGNRYPSYISKSSRKPRQFTQQTRLNAPGISLFTPFSNLIFSAIMDAMCSLASSMIYRAVQNYKIRINTSLSLAPLLVLVSASPVSTSIRFRQLSAEFVDFVAEFCRRSIHDTGRQIRRQNRQISGQNRQIRRLTGGRAS